MADYMTKIDVRNANLVRDAVLKALYKEGMITLENAIHFKGNYAVIHAEKSWFESIFSKLFPKYEEGIYYRVVKFVGDIDDDEEDVDNDDSLEELQFKLVQAEKNEDFELAKKLKLLIDSKNKK